MDIDERSGGAPAPGDVPRLVAWLRSERPAASDAEVGAVLGRLPADRVRRLEAVLTDLAGGCGAPSPGDLAALAELDDLLGGGSGRASDGG